MKLGFLFPGQGAQYVGMGKDLYEEYEEVRKIYDKAKEITGIDVAKLSFESTIEELSQTKNTQIVVLVMSLAILEVLKTKNINAEISAGLSLGEYTSLVNSGIISLENALRIVQKRGKIMQEYVPEGYWKMASIIGLDDNKVEEICKKVKAGFVVPANYNCPGQVAISGEKEAIYEAMQIAKEEGAKLAIELQTGGPFHTEKLQEASDKLRNELENITINEEFKGITIKNIDAKEYTKDDNIRDILAKHVISPVRFKESISRMIELGVDTFVEIGPGKALSGFAKRTDKNVKTMNITDVKTLNNVLETII